MDEKITTNDLKLIDREMHYRRINAFCKLIAFICIFTFLGIFPFSNNVEELLFLPYSSVFWFALAHYAGIKIKHIESIKFYRKKLNLSKGIASNLLKNKKKITSH